MFLTDPQGDKSSREPQVKSLEPWRLDLLKAAAYIEKYGWCQNDLRDRQGRVCMVGALNAVSGSYSEAWWYLQGALKGCVGGWNDRPERTQEQVVAKLRAIAIDPNPVRWKAL